MTSEAPETATAQFFQPAHTWPTRHLSRSQEFEAGAITHLQTRLPANAFVHPLLVGDTDLGPVMVAVATAPALSQKGDLYVVVGEAGGLLSRFVPLARPYDQQMIAVGLTRGVRSCVVALASPTVMLGRTMEQVASETSPQFLGVHVWSGAGNDHLFGRDITTGLQQKTDVLRIEL